MKMPSKRLVVYTKDVVLVTGQCERTARRLLKKIRKHYGLDDKTYVSLEAFCSYTGLSEEKLKEVIG